jgi:F-type H+-transporting ATPase subunit b
MRRLLLMGLVACLALTAQERAPEEAKAGEAKEAAGHEEGDPLAIWKWANFGILALGLGYLAAKGLGAMFRTRSGEISKGIAEARAMKADAEKRAAEIDKRVSALGSEVEKLRKESVAEMEKEGERIRQETAAAVAKAEYQAELEIDAAAKGARRELREYTAKLSLDMAEQRLRSKIDAATEGRLIDGFVSDLNRQESAN